MFEKNEELPSIVTNSLNGTACTIWRNVYNANEKNGETFAMLKAWLHLERLAKAKDYLGQPRGEDGRFLRGKQTERQKEESGTKVAGAYPVWLTEEPPKGRPPRA